MMVIRPPRQSQTLPGCGLPISTPDRVGPPDRSVNASPERYDWGRMRLQLGPDDHRPVRPRHPRADVQHRCRPHHRHHCSRGAPARGYPRPNSTQVADVANAATGYGGIYALFQAPQPAAAARRRELLIPGRTWAAEGAVTSSAARRRRDPSPQPRRHQPSPHAVPAGGCLPPHLGCGGARRSGRER